VFAKLQAFVGFAGNGLPMWGDIGSNHPIKSIDDAVQRLKNAAHNYNTMVLRSKLIGPDVDGIILYVGEPPSPPPCQT